MNDELRNQYHECPTIYVSLASGMDERAYRWVAVGAEEEGVPCLLVPPAAPEATALALATAAARGSRLGVGVGIAGDRVVLQEAHMPVDQPVYCFPVEQDLLLVCRLAGSSAGRMVKRMPLRFKLDEIQPAEAPVTKPAYEPALKPVTANGNGSAAPALANDPAAVAPADLVNLIVRILAERGLS